MDQQSNEDLARHVRELEAENQSLLDEKEHFQGETQHLRDMVKEKSCAISAHEALHGRVFPRLPP